MLLHTPVFLSRYRLVSVNIPVIYWLIGIYYKTHCYTIDELFYELVAGDDDLEDKDETLLESLD